jgi:hypothetical protein
VALDFPNSPTIGQTYTSGGLTWKWDGVRWTVPGVVIITEYGSGAAATGPLTVIPNYLGGLTLSNDTTSANTVIDIATGGAASDDNAAMMTLPNAFTKSISGTWAVNSGSAGLDAGAVAASTWYHVFLIGNTSTGAVDVLFSTSATAPTMTLPNAAGFTKKRRIGSIKTNASSQIILFTQVGDQFLWITPTVDYTNGGVTVAMSALTLTVPTGVKVIADVNGYFVGSVVGNAVTILSPDQTGASQGVPAGNQQLLVQVANIPVVMKGSFRTNISGQILIGGNAAFAAGLWVDTFGWLDNRGK